MSKFHSNKDGELEKRTFKYQEKLPKLPIPPLEDTCKRYLKALEALQDETEHATTKAAVEDFLKNDGPLIQDKLIEWAKTKDRCVFICLDYRISC